MWTKIGADFKISANLYTSKTEKKLQTEVRLIYCAGTVGGQADGRKHFFDESLTPGYKAGAKMFQADRQKEVNIASTAIFFISALRA